MRIAVAGIGHETNTFSSLRTRMEDFWVRRGPECLQGEAWSQFPGVEFLPTLMAGATPNGLVDEATYLALKTELLQRLTDQLPVDGVYLSLHGAMHVEGIGDGETDLAAAVRALVGDAVPIAVSLDLHGNLSHEFVGSVNILSALRTAPHIDGAETRKRTLDLLVRAVREGKKLVTAMVKLPLILPGENAVTAIEPSKSLYGYLTDIADREGIWDASLMIGCAWTDSPYTAVSPLVVGEDLTTAKESALEFAERVWTRRAEFGPEVEVFSADVAIAQAVAYPEGPVFVSESGDNVTAGGAGDVPWFLDKLLRAGVKDTLYVGLTDSEAVRLCTEASVGDHVELSLGGKLDRQSAPPLNITAEVLRVDGGTATVQTDGVTIVITDGRRPFHTLEAFEPSGIDPLSKKIVVVKQGYLSPDLRERCSTTFMALTPGFTDLRIEELPYHEIQRPMYPLDSDCEFEAR